MHNRVEIAEDPIPIQEERQAVPQVGKNALTVAKSDIFQNTASPKQSQNKKVNRKYTHHITAEKQPVSKHPVSTDTDDEFTFNIYDKQKQPQVTVSIANIPIRVLIDSGSTVNVINEGTFKVIKRHSKTNLVKSTATIHCYKKNIC